MTQPKTPKQPASNTKTTFQGPSGQIGNTGQRREASFGLHPGMENKAAKPIKPVAKHATWEPFALPALPSGLGSKEVPSAATKATEQ